MDRQYKQLNFLPGIESAKEQGNDFSDFNLDASMAC